MGGLTLTFVFALFGCGVAVGVAPGTPGVLDLGQIGPVTIVVIFLQTR